MPFADPHWVRILRHRLDDFEAMTRRTGVACSLKWRTVSGHFDRTSSPAAYRIIDGAVRRSAAPGRWLELHSNGPELLLYLAIIPDGFAVSAAVVALLAALANARDEGAREGDAAAAPIELIIRRFDECGRYVEQMLLALPPGAATTEAAVAAALKAHAITIHA